MVSDALHGCVQAKHKDQLVSLTEAAIMSEVEQFYQNTFNDNPEDVEHTANAAENDGIS